MKQFQSSSASWKRICEAFSVPESQSMRRVAEEALNKEYRAYLLKFDSKGKVVSADISSLDPGAEDESTSGWGGLTEYSSRFGDAVRAAVNEAAR
jgi:hypothetical protein